MVKANRFFSRERKILDAKDVSLKTMFKHSIVNFGYGFLAGSIPAFISMHSDVGTFTSAFCYYLFLGFILKRPAYETRLGKWVLFGVSAASGITLASYLIRTFLN